MRPFPQAILLAKATGRPVRVLWSREEEFGMDALRPLSFARFKAALLFFQCPFGNHGPELRNFFLKLLENAFHIRPVKTGAGGAGRDLLGFVNCRQFAGNTVQNGPLFAGAAFPLFSLFFRFDGVQ